MLGVTDDRQTIPPRRVLAFENELEYWLATAQREVRLSREGDSLRIEIGGWTRPRLVGCIAYETIEAAADWRALAWQVSRCQPTDEWWHQPVLPGQEAR